MYLCNWWRLAKCRVHEREVELAFSGQRVAAEGHGDLLHRDLEAGRRERFHKYVGRPKAVAFVAIVRARSRIQNFNVVEVNLRPANSLTLGPVGPPVDLTKQGESQDFALLCGGF